VTFLTMIFYYLIMSSTLWIFSCVITCNYVLLFIDSSYQMW